MITYESFSKPHFLAYAATVGIAGLMFVDIISLILYSQGQLGVMAPSIVMFYAIVGMPIGLIVSFLLGWPLLIGLETFGNVSLRNIIILGGIIGIIVAPLNIIYLIGFGEELWKIIIDWILSALIGGFAGYMAYKKIIA